MKKKRSQRVIYYFQNLSDTAMVALMFSITFIISGIMGIVLSAYYTDSTNVADYTINSSGHCDGGINLKINYQSTISK